MQTPITPGLKRALCQICQRADATVLVYSTRTKRKTGVCAGCAADDEHLEKKYRSGDKWKRNVNTGDDEPM